MISTVGPFVAAVHGMAVDQGGLLYFSDSFTQHDTTPRVYRLAPPYTGEPEATPIGGARPAGLAFIDGRLYVCDVGAGTVTRHDDALAPVQTWAVPSPWNVAAVGSGERVAVTFDGRLMRLAPDGAVTELHNGLDAPFDLVPAPGGGVWISEQVADPAAPGRVIRWEAGGQPPQLVGDYPWANPEGLGVDPQGNLWVAETERKELVRISVDGVVERMAEVDGLPVVIVEVPGGDLLVSVTGPRPHLLRVALGG